MTNDEWLKQLAQNAPDELAAWFDAEHVENQERALDGDTEPENADSRERLEADVRNFAEKSGWLYPIAGTRIVLEWLDRQAAITERECRKPNWDYCETCETLTELTAEREDWKKHARAAENACYETMLERDHYRSKFGKCLDYADAIHALMDDEGMA